MKTHDNQKPFQCTVCNRGYNTAAALTSHMQNHKRGENGGSLGIGSQTPGTRSIPGYRCLQCGDRFRRPDLLQVITQILLIFIIYLYHNELQF